MYVLCKITVKVTVKRVHIYVQCDFMLVEVEAQCGYSHEKTKQQHEVE